jgi:hypothetical protein
MYVFAQDIIVTKKSERIDAKVLEININDIKYKDWDNLEGPTYTMLKSDIASIVYRNGKVETFSDAPQEQPQQKQNYNKEYGVAPNNMTYSKFVSMSDREQDEYFENYLENSNIYDTFHSGVKLRRASLGLFLPGLALSCAGFIMTMVGAVSYSSYYYYDYYGYYHYYNDYGLMYAGIGLLCAGEALVIVSIPIGAIGGAKKKHAQNEFIDTYFKETSMHNKPMLNLGLNTGGVGFTLKF